MNRKELVRTVAHKNGFTMKDVDSVVESILETITDELKNDRTVNIVNFGKFSVTTRAARTGRNPQTGELIEIASSRTPSFKASGAFKNELN